MNFEDLHQQLILEGQLEMSLIRKTAERVVKILRTNGMHCKLIDGYAVNFYGYKRYTNDADFIVSDKTEAMNILTNSGWFRAIPGSTMSLTDKETKITVNLLQSGSKDSSKAIPYSNPADHVILYNIPTISLLELIELKLGSYLSAGIKRSKDRTDVIEMIMANNLPENFMDNSQYPNIVAEYKAIWNELNQG